MVISPFVSSQSRLPHPWLDAPSVDDGQDPSQKHPGSLHGPLLVLQTQPGDPGAPAGVAHHPAQRYKQENVWNEGSS